MIRDSLVASAYLAKGIKSDQLGITGPKQQIFINEHLTLKNKGLFQEVRETAKKCAWIKHGNILVRESDTTPVIAIRSRSDLCKIKNCRIVNFYNSSFLVKNYLVGFFIISISHFSNKIKDL